MVSNHIINRSCGTLGEKLPRDPQLSRQMKVSYMRYRYFLNAFIIFIAFFSRHSCSQGIHMNFGAGTLGPIPVLMGEIEYKYLDQSVRLNYFSNFEIKTFGSSAYEGISIEYTFNEDKNELNSNNQYLSIGGATKRKGTTYNENYRYIAIGYEKRYLQLSKGLFGNGYTFLRYYLSYIEEEDLSPFNRDKKRYVFPGISFGIGY